MQAIFYNFTKKENSTKTPDEAGTSIDIYLKDNTSMLHPSIELKLADAPSWNYCYIPEFRRYYYVYDWAYYRGTWSASCNHDPLASWRTDISRASLYVLRSAAEYDGAINDDMYPAKAEPAQQNIRITDGDNFVWFKEQQDLEDGVYVLGVVNSSEAVQGAAAYYVLTNAELRNLLSYLMANTSYLDVPTDIAVNGIPDELLKTLYNPFQYIVSCKWFPQYNGAQDGTIKYGWWSTSVSAKKLNGAVRYYDGYFNIPEHPQAASRGAYLNGSPYTRIDLMIQPFGIIPVDPALLVNTSASRVDVRCMVDYVTGAAMLTITIGGTLVKTVSTQMGVDIQLAQMAVDKLTQAETVITGAAEVSRATFTTKNILDPVSGAANAVEATAHAVADGIRSSFPQTQISGANGSLLFTHLRARCMVYHYPLVDEDREHNGRPLCQIKQLGTLPGYQLIRDGDIPINGTREEALAIKTYLETGFYYE